MAKVDKVQAAKNRARLKAIADAAKAKAKAKADKAKADKIKLDKAKAKAKADNALKLAIKNKKFLGANGKYYSTKAEAEKQNKKVNLDNLKSRIPNGSSQDQDVKNSGYFGPADNSVIRTRNNITKKPVKSGKLGLSLRKVETGLNKGKDMMLMDYMQNTSNQRASSKNVNYNPMDFSFANPSQMSAGYISGMNEEKRKASIKISRETGTLDGMNLTNNYANPNFGAKNAKGSLGSTSVYNAKVLKDLNGNIIKTSPFSTSTGYKNKLSPTAQRARSRGATGSIKTSIQSFETFAKNPNISPSTFSPIYTGGKGGAQASLPNTSLYGNFANPSFTAINPTSKVKPVKIKPTKMNQDQFSQNIKLLSAGFNLSDIDARKVIAQKSASSNARLSKISIKRAQDMAVSFKGNPNLPEANKIMYELGKDPISVVTTRRRQGRYTTSYKGGDPNNILGEFYENKSIVDFATANSDIKPTGVFYDPNLNATQIRGKIKNMEAAALRSNNNSDDVVLISTGKSTPRRLSHSSGRNRYYTGGQTIYYRFTPAQAAKYKALNSQIKKSGSQGQAAFAQNFESVLDERKADVMKYIGKDFAAEYEGTISAAKTKVTEAKALQGTGKYQSIKKAQEKVVADHRASVDTQFKLEAPQTAIRRATAVKKVSDSWDGRISVAEKNFEASKITTAAYRKKILRKMRGANPKAIAWNMGQIQYHVTQEQRNLSNLRAGKISEVNRVGSNFDQIEQARKRIAYATTNQEVKEILWGAKKIPGAAKLFEDNGVSSAVIGRYWRAKNSGSRNVNRMTAEIGFYFLGGGSSADWSAKIKAEDQNRNSHLLGRAPQPLPQYAPPAPTLIQAEQAGEAQFVASEQKKVDDLVANRGDTRYSYAQYTAKDIDEFEGISNDLKSNYDQFDSNLDIISSNIKSEQSNLSLFNTNIGTLKQGITTVNRIRGKSNANKTYADTTKQVSIGSQPDQNLSNVYNLNTLSAAVGVKEKQQVSALKQFEIAQSNTKSREQLQKVLITELKSVQKERVKERANAQLTQVNQLLKRRTVTRKVAAKMKADIIKDVASQNKAITGVDGSVPLPDITEIDPDLRSEAQKILSTTKGIIKATNKANAKAKLRQVTRSRKPSSSPVGKVLSRGSTVPRPRDQFPNRSTTLGSQNAGRISNPFIDGQ